MWKRLTLHGEENYKTKSRVTSSFSRCFALVLIPIESVWLPGHLVVIALTIQIVFVRGCDLACFQYRYTVACSLSVQLLCHCVLASSDYKEKKKGSTANWNYCTVNPCDSDVHIVSETLILSFFLIASFGNLPGSFILRVFRISFLHLVRQTVISFNPSIWSHILPTFEKMCPLLSVLPKNIYMFT